MKTKRGDARNTAGRWKRSFHMGEQLVLGRAILNLKIFLSSCVLGGSSQSLFQCFIGPWWSVSSPFRIGLLLFQMDPNGLSMTINRYYHPDDFYTSSWEPILQVGLSPLVKRMTVVRLWGGENPEAVCKSRPFGHLQNSWKKHPIQQEETSTNQQGCTKHTSWRFVSTHLKKICSSDWIISLRNRGEKKHYLKPTPSF